MEDPNDKFKQSSFYIKLSDEILTIKTEMMQISKHSKRKSVLLKEDKLVITKFETKSNSVKILAEEVVIALQGFASQVELLQANVSQMKTVMMVKRLDHRG